MSDVRKSAVAVWFRGPLTYVPYPHSSRRFSRLYFSSLIRQAAEMVKVHKLSAAGNILADLPETVEQKGVANLKTVIVGARRLCVSNLKKRSRAEDAVVVRS
jgi:hypothetical protein